MIFGNVEGPQIDKDECLHGSAIGRTLSQQGILSEYEIVTFGNVRQQVVKT